MSNQLTLIDPAMSGDPNTLPTLNAKTIDPEYRTQINDQGVARILIRLSSEYGDPYGQDAALAAQKRIEWSRAIGERSKTAMEQAVDKWIATNSKWPKVAELIRLADGIMDTQIKKAVDKFKLHPARVKLPASYIGFTLRQSPLRDSTSWASWLNTVHPMAEHGYFAEAQMARFEHVIEGMSEFSIEYVVSHFYESLEKHFGRKIAFIKPEA